MSNSRLLPLYVKILERFHYVFLVLWLAAAITCSFFVMDFVSSCKLSFRAPPGTPVAAAVAQREKQFPESKNQVSISLFARIIEHEALGYFVDTAAVSSPAPHMRVSTLFLQQSGEESAEANGNGTTTTTATAAAVTSPPSTGYLPRSTPRSCTNKNNITAVAETIADIPSVAVFFDLISLKALEMNPKIDVANYFVLRAMGADNVASGFLSAAHRSMLLLPCVLPEQFSSKAARTMGSDLMDFRASIESSVLRNATLNLELDPTGALFSHDEDYVRCISEKLTSGGTGVPVMEAEMVSASEKDLGKIDAICLPLAILIMGLVVVSSLRLLIFPALAIGLTLLCSFGLMYPVAQHIDVISATPSLMMSITIAISTDACIFILARYVEEVRAGERGAAAVLKCLSTAGSTIFVSGLCLCTSFIALCFFPMQLLRSFGIGCSITIIVALCVTMNLAPALLLAFPGFFERAAFPTQLPACMPQWRCWTWFGFFLAAPVSGDDDIDENTPVRQTRQSISSPVPTLEASEGFGAGTSPQGQRMSYGGTAAGAAAGDDATESHSTLETPSLGNSYQDQVGASKRLGQKSGGGGGGDEPNKKQNLSNNSKDKNNNSANNSSKPLPAAAKSNLSTATITLSSEQFDPAIAPVPSSPLFDTPNVTQLLRRELAAQFGDAVGDSIFFRLAPMLRWPWNVLVCLVILGITCYVGSFTLEITTTDEMSAFLGRGSPTRDDLLQVRAEFGPGAPLPYNFLFNILAEDVSSNTNVNNTNTNILLNATAFYSVQYVLSALANGTGTTLAHFRGPFTNGLEFTTPEQVLNCSTTTTTSSSSNISGSPLLSPFCDKNILSMINNMTINAAQNAALVTFVGPEDPTGNNGNSFYRKLLRIIDDNKNPSKEELEEWMKKNKIIMRNNNNNNNNNNLTTPPTMGVYVLGVGAMSMDMVKVVYSNFPMLGVAVICAVTVFTGLAFKSVVVPLRCLISIAMTEMFVFGFLVLVYQHGILAWTGADCLQKTGALSWLSPVVAFLVIVGVATDMDLFLTFRILQFITEEGVGTQDATLLGLCASSKLISAAGGIMGIAFGGLLFTSQQLLNELGLFLLVGALFDTFVVRPFFVPCLISILGRYHWWPLHPEMGLTGPHMLFGPSDSISARASQARREGSGYDEYYAGGGGGGGGNDYGTSRLYATIDAGGGSNHQGRGGVNKSNQMLEQQKQRLQHLFGE